MDCDLVLLDDVVIGHAGISKTTRYRRKLADNCGGLEGSPADAGPASQELAPMSEPNDATTCDGGKLQPPPEIGSNDPEVLRAALLRESTERKRAECQAHMQTEVVQLALDLLVREPNIEGFFGALTKTMVEEGESHTCAVWLLDEQLDKCGLWLAYVKDQLFIPSKHALHPCALDSAAVRTFPCEVMATHLYQHAPGWNGTVEYGGNDPRLPEALRSFGRDNEWNAMIATPLIVGNRNLGWMTSCTSENAEPDSRWWRVVLMEAIARQAALALHHSRTVESKQREERRKAILEERNRLARDIHDNLAQGFAAILMQLQSAQRELGRVSPGAAASVETAVHLARTHLAEARRSVGSLRPNVGSGEDITTALKRLVDLGQRTATVPIELIADELPRLGDGVEREVVAIAQEALTNAVKHSRAQRIVVRASTVQSVGLRLTVTDDGRGIGREPTSGFGMTSMQERADRIGASLTIVTAPRNGTEVVLAWEPSALPTQVHAVN
jgi:signal transduction histidine kinase